MHATDCGQSNVSMPTGQTDGRTPERYDALVARFVQRDKKSERLLNLTGDVSNLIQRPVDDEIK